MPTVVLTFILASPLLTLPSAAQGIITTVAGTTWVFPSSASGGPAASAPLGSLSGIAADSSGNVFAADSGNQVAVKISPSGVLNVVAGNGIRGFSGDAGPAVSASLSLSLGLGLGVALPISSGVAVDSSGNLYIADTGNWRIRKISPNGTITTFAGGGSASPGDGGPATSATLSYLWGLAIDAAGNLYIADSNDFRVRKVSTSGTITTVAGVGFGSFGDGGPATQAGVHPSGVAVDGSGNLFISEATNNRVRKVSSGGIITTVAGNGRAGFSGDGGPATSASLSSPSGVAADAGGNLYIADFLNHRVRKVSPSGIISTAAGNGTQGFSGDGGPALNASLDSPTTVAVDAAGNLYIAERGRIRKVTPAGIITTVAGSGLFKATGDGGPATSASLNGPNALAVDVAGNLFIADNNRVRRVTTDGTITTVAGNGTAGFTGDFGPATSASLSPDRVALDAAGNLFIADSRSHRIRKVDGRGMITTVAGNGTTGFSGDGGSATSASLFYPSGVAVDGSENLYIADRFNNRIRKVNPAGQITTVAGNGTRGFSGDGGPATTASLIDPLSVTVDVAGNLYIVEYPNTGSPGFRIRKVSPAGIITTVAGNGGFGFSGDGGPATSAMIAPWAVTADAAGNLFIADSWNQRVRKVDTTGIITTVAGNGVFGFSGDGGPATSASLFYPLGIAVDSFGNLYIADSFNGRIRKVLAIAPSLSLAPAKLSFSAIAGAAAAAVQQVAVTGTVAGLTWTAQVSTESGGNWLSVSPTSGTVPGTISATVNPAALAAGTYRGAVTVRAPLAAPATQTVAVELTVQPAAAAQLAVEPSALTFETAVASANPAPQTLRISNAGGGTLDWTAHATTTSGVNWLAPTPASGSASAGAPTTVQVVANASGLPAGTYLGSIVVESSTTKETKTIAVTLLVSQVTQTMLVSQSGLLFTGVESGGAEPPQSFGILNNGQGTMNWTAQASTLSGGNWLSVSPTSGTSTANSLQVPLVDVAVNVSGLRAGQYSGLVRVAAPGANNSPQFAIVTLNVLPPGSAPPTLVRPTGLIFVRQAGTSSPGSQTVRLATASPRTVEAVGGVLTFDGGNWLDALPRNLVFAAAAPGTITVQPTLGTLSAGQYRGALTMLFSDGTAQTVNALFVVTRPAGTGTLASLSSGADQRCAPQQLYAAVRTLSNNFASPVNWPSRLEVQVKDDCDNAIPNATVTASFSNGDPPLALVSLRNGLYEATWRPVNAAPVRVTVRAESSPLTAAQTSVDGQVTGNAAVAPALFSGGIVHGASFASGALAPGSIVAIFGRSMASAKASATQVPLPTTLGEAVLSIGGQDAPLFFSSDAQINAQLPFELPPNSRVQVVAKRTGAAAVPETITIAAVRPGIFSTNQQGTGQGAILNALGRLVESSAPAAAGDVVAVYCTGLGTTQLAVKSGEPAPVSPLANVTTTVTATAGGQPATVQFAGLAPGFVGLYQVNVQIPAGITPGPTVPLVLSQNGVPSNTVTLAIK